jgi:hypothetical protein
MNKKIGMIIYFSDNEEFMEKFKNIFEKIKDSGKFGNGYFSIDSKKIIRNTISKEEELFNSVQKQAYSNNYNKVIYSFVI